MQSPYRHRRWHGVGQVGGPRTIKGDWNPTIDPPELAADFLHPLVQQGPENLHINARRRGSHFVLPCNFILEKIGSSGNQSNMRTVGLYCVLDGIFIFSKPLQGHFYQEKILHGVALRGGNHRMNTRFA